MSAFAKANASLMPRGSHRLKHDSAKAAAMLQADPPAGRPNVAGVLTAFVQRALLRLHQIRKYKNQSSRNVFFADLVVLARGPGPDPIPNSNVKSLRANGTKSQDLGE